MFALFVCWFLLTYTYMYMKLVFWLVSFLACLARTINLDVKSRLSTHKQFICSLISNKNFIVVVCYFHLFCSSQSAPVG
jgi:hypothetical protein